jgi:transcriptional regulator with GAF, ATPase, and Fis domain
MKQHLLTFIGDNDCKLPQQTGAILNLLARKSFDRVSILYSAERYISGIAAIQQYAKARWENVLIRPVEALVENPTDYNTVYPAMFAAASAILKEFPQDEFTVSVTSGTPTMHSSWIFLVKGGVIPASMVQIARDGTITDIHLELDDFPEIRRIDTIKAQNTWLHRENRQLRKTLLSGSEKVQNVSTLENDRILGQSPAILEMKKQLARIAPTDIAVFISGESGTGKELAAQTIHQNSPRRNKAFVAINCGAIPEALFESEFFGHVKGSFTGAVSDRKGKLREADGGSLFLDEVAELPLTMQVKLLRILQEGEFSAVGDEKVQSVNLRIISATNSKLREAVAEGRFRRDLFYRLVQFELNLPPLRERGDDCLLIARQLLQSLNEKHHKSITFHKETEKKIVNAVWEGNIRQLISAVQVAWQLAEDTIQPEDLIIAEGFQTQLQFPFPEEGISLEKHIKPAYFRLAMEKAQGNAEKAAALLGMNGPAFRAQWRKMNEE